MQQHHLRTILGNLLWQLFTADYLSNTVMWHWLNSHFSHYKVISDKQAGLQNSEVKAPPFNYISHILLRRIFNTRWKKPKKKCTGQNNFPASLPFTEKVISAVIFSLISLSLMHHMLTHPSPTLSSRGTLAGTNGKSACWLNVFYRKSALWRCSHFLTAVVWSV